MRDVRGRPVEAQGKEHQEHRDRLDRIEKHLGIAHKASGMKPEDQGGSGKAGAGHVTERAGPSYGRKRH